MDVDRAKIETIEKGVSPIHEAGLEPLLRSSIRRKKIMFSHRFQGLTKAKVIFITVGTPSRHDGSIDTTFVESACREVGRQLSFTRGYRLVMVKSTVTPGTTEGIVRQILERESKKEIGSDLGLATNPEFLHEGSAIEETLHPEAIVIGGHDIRSTKALLRLYDAFYRRKFPTILTTPANAEMIKYAINAGRATQLSFVNTIANLCTRIPGADYDEVRKALSLVGRMDQRYLTAGMGFGGSCVPPYTEVATDTGFKPISSIEVGERVLSHDGAFHRVTKTFVRDYDGMMHLFRSQGFSSSPLEVTPGHQILSSLRNTGGRSRFYETKIPGRGLVQKMSNLYLIEPSNFVDPSELTRGDFMVLPAPKEVMLTIPVVEMTSKRRHHALQLCPDLMYLFGLWLAEGILDLNTGEVMFSLHAKETDLLEEIDRITREYLGVRARIKRSNTKGNSLAVRVKSRAFADFLEKTFSHRAEGKRIPWEWLRLPASLLIPLLRGMWYGDGSNRNSWPYDRFAYATASPYLADFVELMLLKLKTPYRRLKSKERIDSNGIHHREAYYFLGVDNSKMNELLPRLGIDLPSQRHRTSWFEGADYLFPIKDVKVEKYRGKVHNLEVEESNSYVVRGATLHNCLPKDARALSAVLKSRGVSSDLVDSALRINASQVSEVLRLAERHCGALDGKKVGVLGLSFKAGTDDIRESVAISLVRALVRAGAEVSVYDPAAMLNARQLFGSQVSYARSPKECLRGSHCAIIATGWSSFKNLSPKELKSLMKSPVVIDGRRLLSQDRFLKAGIEIETIGTGPRKDSSLAEEKNRPSKEWHYIVEDGVTRSIGDTP